jgi:hypothetical protein
MRIALPYLILLLTGSLPLIAADQEMPRSNPSTIRIVTVEPTPEASKVGVKIIYPEDEKTQENPLDILVRVDGYPLKTASEFPREEEVLNRTSAGQSIHIIIDNEPYFLQNEAIINALQDQEMYYEQVVNFQIPSLSPGQHLIRIFPARSYGESLKSEGCFAMRLFSLSDDQRKLDVDPNGPILTYNEPQGEFSYSASKPLLFDFYITNAQLSRDGYKVRLTIDSNVQRILTRWTPYYIYGLTKGVHKLQIELLDKNNQLVPGMTNRVTQTIVLK